MFSVTALLNSARTLGSLVMLGVILFFYTVYAQAGQVTLTWNANIESILGGYGQTSDNYTANVDVGNKTSYNLGSLEEGKTYYFAVKAYAIGGLIWSGVTSPPDFGASVHSWGPLRFPMVRCASVVIASGHTNPSRAVSMSSVFITAP